MTTSAGKMIAIAESNAAKLEDQQARIAALEAALRNLLNRLGGRDVMDSLAVPSPRMEVFEVMDEARALLEGEKPQ